MAGILIWGKARELIAGEFAAGVPTHEVDGFSELRARLEAGAGTLVVADAARLEAEHEPLEAWLKDGGSLRAVVTGVAERDEIDDLIRRFPFLDDCFERPVTPARLRLRMERGLDGLHNRRVIEQLEAAVNRKSSELHELNKIGVALSAERDIDKLLELILQKCREITSADAGSLYLVERGSSPGSRDDVLLRFKLTQNDSVVVSFEEFTMPLDETSISGYVALTGQGVNIADAYDTPPGAPYRISRSFDEQSGYRTKSMLVVPMRDHQDTVIGVIQLINKKREAAAVLRPVALADEMVVPFMWVDEELVTSLASQAAVAFENTRLIEDIKRLFDAFVRASVKAIESRDPTTSGHSSRVAELTVGIAEKVDAIDHGRFRNVRFSRDQLQEIRFAGLLHDFGKVGVREKVLIKGKKLYVGQLMVIRQRFAYVKRTIEVEHLRAKLDLVSRGDANPEVLARMDAEYEQRLTEIDAILRDVLRANEPTVVANESIRALLNHPALTFRNIDGAPEPLLTRNEVLALSIKRGSLSEKERREIESHVTHTYRFLAEIPWTSEYQQIPAIAHGHHEKLDGTGYPRGLRNGDIPLQAKMMTIADIYDALIAWDRPYKRSVSVERALEILKEEAAEGKLDADLLDVFIEAKIYERTLSSGEIEANRPGDSPAFYKPILV
ncbi:MAG: GAF domain-containing protein [Vicinamibacteria bacterium]|nr:GAF domain-containing protein [Vicinamibacteria bacterium]